MEPGLYSKCRAPLIWLLAILIWGYILGYLLPSLPPLNLALSSLILAFTTLLLIRRNSRFSQTAWSFFFLVSGTLTACAFFIIRLNLPDPIWRELPEREAYFSLEVTRVFQTKDQYGRVSGIAQIFHAPPHLADLIDQRVYFQLKPLKENKNPVRSEKFRAVGVLKYIVDDESESSFGEYLRRSGVFFEFRRGKILDQEKPARWFYRFCANQNAHFESILRLGSNGLNPFDGIYVAMMLGNKSALSSPQKQAFTASGTMHFFAISGLHVAAVALSLHLFLAFLRVPTAPAAGIGLVLLLLYVQITGAAPSAVRAYLMVLFFWSSRVLHRQPSSFSALLMSALVVLLYDPRQLFNPGFQLSYAVVGSILLYGLPLMEKLKDRIRLFRGLPESSYTWRHRAAVWLNQRFIELLPISLAATIASAPLTIYYFKIFTPGAIFLNMALVPLASLLIACGCISLLCGLLHAVWLSTFFNHGAWVIIWIMNRLVGLALFVPGFFYHLEFAHKILGLFAITVILVVMLAAHSKQLIRTRLAFLAPPLALALFLFFGTNSILNP